MRRFILLLFITALASFASRSHAQPTAEPISVSDSLNQQMKGFVLGFGGAGGLARGGFADEVGVRQGGADVFFGLHLTSQWIVGLDIEGYRLEHRSESVRLAAGPSVALETTTEVARLALFVRYSPPLGVVQPYAEGLLGVNAFTTRTTFKGAPDDAPGQNAKNSATPAAGVGLGVAVRLHKWVDMPASLHIVVRHVLGGETSYLIYDEAEGRLTSRSSGTTVSSLSVGLTFGF